MAQYLVNATMIWLLSLLAFDLLLRRESYHAYNRLYLLFTFLLGIFLPLWQWDAGGNVYNTVTGSGTISAVITVKESIVHTTALPQDNPDHTNWIWVIYIAGVAVSALFFFREAFMLFKYFHKGKKSKDGVWSIIETGEKHSPFSAFRYIFISNKSDYSTEELNMILLHEELHGHALHFVDTMIMQLAKIIFWFHPLIYLYNKRLLLLHEYQADAAASENPVTYGHFLVQQALLTPAPSLSHSFNRSPIKNRIVMLTRKSSFTAGFKRLIAMPLLIICTFLFSQNVLSQDMRQEGGKVYYRGNVFELWSPKDTPDTIMVENPMTGDIELRISRVDSFPVRMNGEEIFRVSELSRMEKETFDRTTGAEVKKYFLEKMKPVMAKMMDGNYAVFTYIILDKKGRIVYINPISIGDRDWRKMPDSYEPLRQSLNKELTKIIEQTSKRFAPVKRTGKVVIMRLEEILPRVTFVVKDHEVTIKE